MWGCIGCAPEQNLYHRDWELVPTVQVCQLRSQGAPQLAVLVRVAEISNGIFMYM